MTESTAADVQTDIPLLQPCCIDLGQHYLVYNNRAWCGCQRLATLHVQPDDDGGDTLIRQSCGAVGSGASDFREQWLRHTKEPRP
jgi:hypothetical protein